MPYFPHKTCCPDPVASAAAIPDEANCSWLHQSHHCVYTPSLLPHPPYQPAPLTAPASCLLTTPWVIWQPISHTAMTASLNAPSNLDPVSNWQISYTECDLCQISVGSAQIFNKHTMTISSKKCIHVSGTMNYITIWNAYTRFNSH